MPVLDGYGAARTIRVQQATRCPMLVALTAVGHDEAKRQAQDAGFNVHMTKPANVDLLVQLLAALGVEH